MVVKRLVFGEGTCVRRQRGLEKWILRELNAIARYKVQTTCKYLTNYTALDLTYYSICVIKISILNMISYYIIYTSLLSL